MTSQPEYDVHLSLNQGFANKILDSLHFPWCAEYNLLPACYPFNTVNAGHADVSAHRDRSDDSNNTNAPDNDNDPKNSTRYSNSTLINENDQDLVIEDLLPEQVMALSEQESMSENATVDMDSDRRFNIDLHHVWLEIPNKPIVRLGNIIQINELTVRVKAKFKASIRVFGKEYSTIKSTPWVSLDGRSATIQLQGSGAKILGALRVENMDLITRVKILQWQYDCQLDLTKFINKQLSQRDPFELLDLSSFQTAVATDAESLCIEHIDFDESGDQLLVKLMLQQPRSEENPIDEKHI